jgi:hypothetical protein
MATITFSSPVLSTAQVARQDQIDICANQAVAAIICTYLEHMNVAIEKGLTTSTSGAGFITESELVSLINSVQGALRTVG